LERIPKVFQHRDAKDYVEGCRRKLLQGLFDRRADEAQARMAAALFADSEVHAHAFGQAIPDSFQVRGVISAAKIQNPQATAA
jgi:hypothetical protein